MLASEEPGGQWEDGSEACGAGQGGGYAPSFEGGHLLPSLQSPSRGPIPVDLPDSEVWILSGNSYFPGPPRVLSQKFLNLPGH